MNRLPYRCAPPLITDRAIAEFHRIAHRVAENSDPEVAAVFAMAVRSVDAELTKATKDRAFLIGERLRWVREHHFASASVRQVERELRKIEAKLKPGERPLIEPQLSVVRVRELNGGRWPSERTIRDALRN